VSTTLCITKFVFHLNRPLPAAFSPDKEPDGWCTQPVGCSLPSDRFSPSPWVGPIQYNLERQFMVIEQTIFKKLWRWLKQVVNILNKILNKRFLTSLSCFYVSKKISSFSPYIYHRETKSYRNRPTLISKEIISEITIKYLGRRRVICMYMMGIAGYVRDHKNLW
jgi:hypothetical protein